MRLYSTLREALFEIRRDLSKAPMVESQRVQSTLVRQRTQELTNYGYSIASEGIPLREDDLVHEVSDILPFWKTHALHLETWLYKELMDRAAGKQIGLYSPDLIHPVLNKYADHGKADYSYSDRLGPWLHIITEHLKAFPTTRRAFWPIFSHSDTRFLSDGVRVPCTIGYEWMIRQGPDGKQLLECTMFSRSNDYEKFLVSDIWFALKLTWYVLATLPQEMATDGIGNISHFTTSLHRFVEEGEEIF